MQWNPVSWVLEQQAYPLGMKFGSVHMQIVACGYDGNIGSIIELYIFLLIYFLNDRENTAIGLKKKSKAPMSELSDALDENKVPNGIVYIYVIGLLSMILKEVIIKRYKSVIKDSGLRIVVVVVMYNGIPQSSTFILVDCLW